MVFLPVTGQAVVCTLSITTSVDLVGVSVADHSECDQTTLAAVSSPVTCNITRQLNQTDFDAYDPASGGLAWDVDVTGTTDPEGTPVSATGNGLIPLQLQPSVQLQDTTAAPVVQAAGGFGRCLDTRWRLCNLAILCSSHYIRTSIKQRADSCSLVGAQP